MDYGDFPGPHVPSVDVRILQVMVEEFKTNLWTWEQAATLSDARLLSYPNFGKVSLKRLRSILKEKGIEAPASETSDIEGRLEALRRRVARLEDLLLDTGLLTFKTNHDLSSF